MWVCACVCAWCQECVHIRLSPSLLWTRLRDPGEKPAPPGLSMAQQSAENGSPSSKSAHTPDLTLPVHLGPSKLTPARSAAGPSLPKLRDDRPLGGAVWGPDPRPQEKREEVFCGLRPRPLVATTLHLLPGGHEAPPGVPLALPFPGPRGGCWLAQDHSPSLLYL